MFGRGKKGIKLWPGCSLKRSSPASYPAIETGQKIVSLCSGYLWCSLNLKSKHPKETQNIVNMVVKQTVFLGNLRYRQPISERCVLIGIVCPRSMVNNSPVFFPEQDYSGCFHRGKRAAIVGRYPAFFFPDVQCFRVSIPSAVRPTLVWQMDIGSLTCAHIWMQVNYGDVCRQRRLSKECVACQIGVKIVVVLPWGSLCVFGESIALRKENLCILI